MEYKWSKKEVLKRLKESIEANDEDNIENYTIMLEMLNNNVDVHHMEMIKKDDHLTFAQQRDYFINDIQYIDEGIIDYISTMFSIEKDEDNLFTKILFDDLDLTDKELIDLRYEIFESMKNPEVLKYYNEFKDKRKHLLHINKISNDKHGLSKDLQGLTLYDYEKEKAFVSIHRRNKIDDITTLTHEFMHALMAYNKEYNAQLCGYFLELEGHFGERLAIEYMKNHGMKKYADSIEAENIYSKLHNSFMIYLSDVLFSTAKNSRFRVKEATNVVREETKYKDALIQHKDIPYICSYNAYDTITNIIDYLIVLELSKKYDIEEQYRMLLELKRQDDYWFFNWVLPDTFDFYTNNMKDFKQLKRKIDKVKRVIE